MTAAVDTPALDTNPFVGPRSFDRTDRLYGRDRETQDLVDLLVAERIVMLHSPSGAGKTSLIRAGLVPRLEDDGFEVLPIVRLTHELPPDLAAAGASEPNTYVLNTLLSLEEGLPAERQRPLGEIAELTLAQYLDGRRDLDGRAGNTVLVFDQFEEVVTTDPTDLDAKAEFFAQLGAALSARSRWALFSLREDFLAELDPYVHLVPTRLDHRFRLDLLRVDAALQAMTLPARDAGVVFDPDAATKLADDLRRVRLQRPGGPVDALGPYVEPVQLQVVCRQLWERLPPDARSIDLADVESVGDVDHSLASYYAECVTAAARWADVGERALRDWFERDLVTSQGFRGQTLDGPLGTPPRDRLVLTMLTSVHLLRAESRRGATWYELAHDRLVEPVLADNARWRAENLSDFERRAAWWDEQGRPDHLLLTAAEIASAPANSGVDGHELPKRDGEYLAASLRMQAQVDRERRVNRRTRQWLVIAVVGCVLALASLAVAMRSWFVATQEGLRATEALLLQEGTQQLDTDADLGLLLGLRAASLVDDRTDPDVQTFLQTALDTVPVVQVLRDAGPATSVAYSRDGRFVVTGHADRTVRIRDSATGDIVRSLDAAAMVRAIDVGPGSSVEQLPVAAAGSDGTVQVWPPGGGPAISVPGHRGAVAGVAFSRDGQSIASAGADGSVVVADTRTGNVQRELRRPGAAPVAVNDVDWTPDGRRVVAVDENGVVAVLDVATGAIVREIRGHDGHAVAVDVLGDGSRVATGGQDSAAVWDVETGTEIFRVRTGGPVADVSGSGDGRRLLVIDIVGNVTVVDSDTGYVLRSMRGRGALPLAAQLDPVAPDRVAVASSNGDGAVWDVAVGHEVAPIALEVAADGTAVTAAKDTGTVRVWSADRRELAAIETGPRGLAGAALSADGRRLLVADDEGAASFWPVRAAGPPVQLGTQGVTCVAISADGRTGATGAGAVVTIWNAEDGTPIRTMTTDGGDTIRALAFGPESDQLVGVSADGTATVWNAAVGQVRHTMRLDGRPNAVAWSPTGAVIATTGASTTTQLWDPETGRLRSTLGGHRKQVYDVAFDNTGERLATVGDDGEVNVWNASDGALLVRRPHETWVYRVAFTPDGSHLLVSDQDTTPHVVYLDAAELLETARLRTTRGMTSAECDRYVRPFADCGAGG
jgi:WD40 repeat protein